ncbi:MAG: tRNA (adenosine(37)-N6)-threonylcarbamoyltransferase complex dimerization subunit type 1 TsaB [Bacteroidota bacterium]|nr:tRNA (adenosine(37)-N6)-threonylcarbamoyltransferase complex dimerization subunit type 1 TsaB [Odoribacter sp.]MDP3643787.1 tRNA (adenosine(37)-N6)-threonylcarbamoyltransferase complex dimerization subunit type 1 TsaB [Bacteroidota bacterium]
MGAILIFETSTEICSVALMVNGQVIDLIESGEGQNHARLTTVFAEQLLKKNDIKPGELSAVAVSKGPGSYTGLRIGVSTAKGICYAGNIPLIAIGTLEAMAKHVSLNRLQLGIPEMKPTLFCPMIDARRMEVFSMLLDKEGRIIRPITAQVIDESFLADELSNTQVAFFGNGSAKCRKVLESPNAVFINQISASAQYMSELVWQAYTKKQFEDVAYFEPFYLKDFIATVSKKNMPG